MLASYSDLITKQFWGGSTTYVSDHDQLWTDRLLRATVERITGMAERARYDGRSSTLSTKARRWYRPAISRVSRSDKNCPLLLGVGLGLFAIVDIPVRDLNMPDVTYSLCYFYLQSRTPILTLPSKAKINMETLGHYPYSNRLTATQLISLHLLLYKPTPGCDSDDPHFGPYISILPRDFGGHPLTWVVHRSLGAGSREEDSLLHLLPPSVLSDLLLIERRFWKDWEAVRLYLVGHACILQTYGLNDFGQDDLPDLSSRPRTQSEMILNFVWAWLNGRDSVSAFRRTALD